MDAIGVIPGVGEVADAINGTIYLAEGDYLNAGLSFVSCIPVAGDAAGKGGKAANQALGITGDIAKYGDDVVDVAGDIAKHGDDIADVATDIAKHGDDALGAVSDATKSSKPMTWNEFQHANGGQGMSKAEMSDAWSQYKIDNGISSKKAISDGSHGNSLDNPNTNYGYVLFDKDTNDILKFGETIHPDTRYSKQFLDDHNAGMKILDSGSKRDIHLWQHDMNSYYKNKYGEFPPLNKGGW